MPPIHHTFAPHVDTTYVLHTMRLLLQPWKWHKGKEQQQLQDALKTHFKANVSLFASGREALLAILQSLEMRPGDEIIIQGYTCTVVPNAIQAAGATPIYADIDPETLNLTSETVEPLITNSTRAIICQHTFGMVADTERLRALCDEYDILLIEDCAHIIPDQQGPQDIGKYGDYVFLSFGRDKAISGITGGAVITKKLCHPEPVRPAGGPAQLPSLTIFRFLLYPFIYSIARPLYGVGIGKVLLWLSAKLGLLVPIVTKKEKQGHMDSVLHSMPNACAALALGQFQKLQKINDHRRELTKLYLQACKDNGWKVLNGMTEDLPLQKFPLFVQQAEYVRTQLKKHNIHLFDGWTGCSIVTESPHAEETEKQVLNLPTHPTMSMYQATQLVQFLRKLLS
ncbi:hypothetical protein COU77_00165 [Candidatus Peregrinibacteria bacterium CG10_big_fil_rev_8_21_14_0_10_49_16]|nr:MAG: hypothetical protein COW95_04780 [Candidatus Peregrinibacteria bacterium CG22_combo_CG10-13_8_21_14_all_49_11]PIR52475.1 MAG: hypothetical protein COU77_00165 [Candidatus Peregrinibacteria bacterium CG10_big_fil_rev_8_21_14_0_10_49_16]